MRKLTAVALLIILMSSCSAGGDTPVPAGTWGGAISEDWQQQVYACEKICFDFVLADMVTGKGGIRTNYLDKEHVDAYATGAEQLSESSGLLMLYAVEINDEALFKKLLGFVQGSLDTGEIIAYRYSDEAGAYHVNAFVDDIRIIKALLLADNAFGGGYLETALEYADRLYDTNVKDGYVYDMYDERYGTTNDFITMCYADLYTIKRLGEYDAKWKEILGNMQSIVEAGFINSSFPMYAGSYDYSSGTYGEGDINMVESSLTALNLAQIGECPQETVDWLKNNLKNSAIYGTYSRDGLKINGVQSTAVYAICAMIAREVRDEEMYMLCIDKMNGFQVTDKTSEVYGAFADSVSLELYSFDNLTALLAYRQD